MSDTDIPLPQEPPGLQSAYEHLMWVTNSIKNGGTGGIPRLPKARSLDDFFKDLRSRGDDDPFICENPGP